jgi:polyferredoxin
VIIYALLLAAMALALVVAVLLRTPLELDVIRDRNVLYRPTAEGLIENVYTLKIVNMDNEPHVFVLRASGIEGLALKADVDEIAVIAGEVRELPVRLQVDPCALERQSTTVVFELQAVDNKMLGTREPARFLGPSGC